VNLFLKAKHWQLFIVLMGAMLSAQALMFSSVSKGEAPSAVALVAPTFIMGALVFGWLWSVASACYNALPSELASSPTPMKVGLIYSLVYLVFSGQFFTNPDGGLPGYIVIMHLLAMAAIFYSLGFTSKQLTKLEQGKNVSFYNYSGPFFLFWFFPIGIWFIQPKVNELLGHENA
jgi:hypothetical protein